MSTRKALILLLLPVLLTSYVFATSGNSGKGQSYQTALVYDRETYLDINQLLCFFYNDGQFAYDNANILGKTDGLYYPRGGDKTVIYAAGLWMGAKVNGQIRLAVAEFSSEYVPGPMDSGTFLPDNEDFRVYKINKGDTPASNPDYAEWPSDQGAPLDSLGNPLLLGDQTCWSVFNDADPDRHNNRAGSTPPLGLEVQHTAFAYDRSGALGKVIYMKYLIINKGTDTLEDAYISFWADPDVGDASDDLVGCDTVLSLGYCYNDGSDATYGMSVPAVGFNLLQGPIVETGNINDSAIYMGGWLSGYLNLPMASFSKCINGSDPENFQETYNYMQGLDIDGSPVVDPNGDTTKFFHAGDPVAGTGWLDVASADRRFMMTSGPFTMLPGDTQEVVAAIIIGQGTSCLESITDLKANDLQVQNLYDNDFDMPKPCPNPTVYTRGFDGAIDLIWGTEPENCYQDYRDQLGELFIFEGYNIYQGETESGPWTKVATYDLEANSSYQAFHDIAGDSAFRCTGMLGSEVCDTALRPWDFELIYADVYNPISGGYETIIIQLGSESGLVNHLWLEESFLDGTPLVNGQPYYFAVTPYSVNIEEIWPEDSVYYGVNFLGFNAASLENEIVPITATPQSIATVFTDTAEHVAGSSNGMVIIEYLDLDMLVPGDYSVDFNTDGTWNLSRDGLWILTNQTNQGGNYDYEVVDGMMVRVIGPLPGIDNIVETQNEFGTVDPPDNVFWSLNSTGDFYVSSNVDESSQDALDRFNWMGYIEWEAWELRFTAGGSEYYDWNTDSKWPDRAPFEVWHFNEDSETPDRRDYFFILDTDASGGWSWGDRIYITETEYPSEPLPDYAQDYEWPTSFHLGRIKFNDDSGGSLDAPAIGTIVRFNPTRSNSESDLFTFTVMEAFICGDANSDDAVNISDVVCIINYIFFPGAPPPEPLESGEANCDGSVNISDAVWLLNYIFLDGPAPCECK